MKRFLAVLTIVFCSGIAAGEYVPVSFFWVAVILACLCPVQIFLSKKGACFRISTFLLVFLLGILHVKNADSFAPNEMVRMGLRCQEAPCLLKGVIITHPEKEDILWRFVFVLDQVQCNGINRSCCGRVFVSAPCESRLSYGDELVLRSRMRTVSGSYGDHLRRKKIFFLVQTSDRLAICRTGVNRSNVFEKAAVYLRKKALDFISAHTSSVAGGIAKAMIFGEKEQVPRIFAEAMTRTGTVHILVVSGFNVGIVTMIILMFLKFIRLPKGARLVVAMAVVAGYCFIAGSSSPVARAAIMADVCMTAFFFKRDPDIGNCLAIAALLILTYNPHQLFEIGFQLSFVSVWAITFIYPRLKSMLGAGAIKSGFFKFIVEGFLVSFSAWIGTVAIIAYNFRIFSPVTVVANIIIVPLAGCITITAFIMAGISLVAPGFAEPIAYSLELMVFLLVKINLFIARVPGAYFFLS